MADATAGDAGVVAGIIGGILAILKVCFDFVKNGKRPTKPVPICAGGCKADTHTERLADMAAKINDLHSDRRVNELHTSRLSDAIEKLSEVLAAATAEQSRHADRMTDRMEQLAKRLDS